MSGQRRRRCRGWPALALAIALAVGLTGHRAAAGPVEDAEEAHRHGDYDTATLLQRHYAERSSIAAQVALGQIYEAGTVVRRNLPEAAKWYALAAEQGDGHAQFLLGALIADNDTAGFGDATDAFFWLLLAVERLPQGDERAAAFRLRQSVVGRLDKYDVISVQKRARAWRPKSGK